METEIYKVIEQLEKIKDAITAIQEILKEE